MELFKVVKKGTRVPKPVYGVHRDNYGITYFLFYEPECWFWEMANGYTLYKG